MMTSEGDILDKVNIQSAFHPKTTRKIIAAIALLVILNLIVVYLLNLEKAISLNYPDDAVALARETKKASVIAVFIFFPIVGFFSALLFSLIPYKGISYKAKHRRFALIVILLLNCIFLITLIFNIALYGLV